MNAFGLFQYIRRALVSRKQVCAFVCSDKALQSLHPREQAHEIVLATECEYRIDQVMPYASLALLDFEAVCEEIKNSTFSNSEAETVGRHYLNDSDCCAAQCEGILGSSGLFVDRKEASDGIQLIRQTHRHRHRRGGYIITLSHRLVMIAHSVGDRIRFTLRAGVIAAHDALQFGEFTDHAGDEIGLCQPCSAFGLIGACAFDDTLLDQPACELCHALDLVGDGAQFLMEGNLRQFLRLLVERNLQVLLPEEFGIAQSCREHLFIARNNRRAAIVGDDIGGADKGIGEFPRFVMADEIFLVHPRR